MSTEVATRDAVDDLVATVRGEKFQEQVALALPEGVTPQRFVRITITALQASPEIVECERSSILRSLLQAAGLGLLPDGKESALVSFKGKATLIPMIGGFRKIAGEHGWIIRTNIVYEHDHFEYELGFSPTVRHIPVRPGHDPGKAIAAYAVGVHRDGYQELEVMSAAEIQKVRQVSRSSDRGPWVEWPERMWEKTVGRRLFKKLPMASDDRVTRLIAAEELDDGEAAEKLYGQIPAPTMPGPDAGEGSGIHPGDGGGGDAARLGVPGVVPHPPEPEPGTEVGDTVVDIGKHAGKTLAQIASEPKGESWIGWCIKADDHPQQKAALEFAREKLPQVYEQALTELSV